MNPTLKTILITCAVLFVLATVVYVSVGLQGCNKQGIPLEVVHQLDSMNNEINKRDVKIGVLEYRDSVLKLDYDTKLNGLKNIQPKYIQKVTDIKKLTPVQAADEYYIEAGKQESEMGN